MFSKFDFRERKTKCFSVLTIVESVRLGHVLAAVTVAFLKIQSQILSLRYRPVLVPSNGVQSKTVIECGLWK